MQAHVLGALMSKKDVRDYKLSYTMPEFPESFELTLGKVKNQGSVGSCVAHAIAETIEYHNTLAGNDNKMSVGYIYGNRRCSTYTGYGMRTRDALKGTCAYGDALYSDFPYNEEVPGIITKFENKVDDLHDEASKAHFASYYKLSTPEEIKTALMKDGPVVFAVYWYDDMKVKNGVLVSDYKKEDKSGGHCMVIYGWCKDGWLIRNSWGTLWGIGGNAILPFDAPMREAWGVSDDKSNTPLKKPYNTPFGKFISKIINFILNLFNK